MNHNMKQYIITINPNPDTEWAGIQSGPFASKREALESANEQEVLRPDCYGNHPHPSIVRAETPNCTCYGRWCCSACVLAQLDGKLQLDKRGKYTFRSFQDPEP